MTHLDFKMHQISRLRTGFVLIALFSSSWLCGQTNSEGRQRAEKQLKQALEDSTSHNLVRQADFLILDTEAKAIAFAETVLFASYGKKEILNQKPYEIHNIDNYWVIEGTLKEGWKGGTFLIIVRAKDCQVIRITHGK